ncbi:MAG: hypothetical protein MJ252_20155, partial [archaeon]|nr:hypothetical protein [archaeon]
MIPKDILLVIILYNTSNIARATVNTSSEFLDYTFRQSKQDLLNSPNNKNKMNTFKSKEKLDGHIFDIENTFNINIETISNCYLTSKLKQPQKKYLYQKIMNIQKLFNNKKEMLNTIHDLKGKILITGQIIEESKRRKGESAKIFNYNLKDLTENCNKKYTLVKQFFKKFMEVEIFIQRESQSVLNVEKYGEWRYFSINNFIIQNETLFKKKAFYEYILEELGKKAQEVFEDNSNLQEEEIKEENKTQNKIALIHNNERILNSFKELILSYLNR